MKLFISHQSALEYWRTYRELPRSSARRRCDVVPPSELPTVEPLESSELTLPLHIMLGDPNARRVSQAISQTVKQHVFRAKSPVGCFINVGGGPIVSSPEFCFLQMAGKLSLIELISLGYELCGTYSMPVPSVQELPAWGFYSREPLTSTKKLGAFVDNMSGVKGVQKAKRALRYLQDGSASPMETNLTILLTLPYKLGGYGFPLPKLNSRIVPVKSAKQTAGKIFYSCDLFWPDYDLAVEYDSDFFHTGSERIAEDSKRRNTLSSIGVLVITVTNRQIRSTTEFEKAAKLIAGNMDRRLLYKNPGFATAHRELRSQLFLR
ncbi:MAG: hypothetical protein LBB46_00510 [Coriobacteriaceae bacterium]|jgi:very-short-patch-repair endonuclease|nr:hypothetical protein [Coriobacteriaceae bacterium]